MECVICDRETGEAEPPGGWVHRDALWSVCVAEGFEVPGWLFVELRHHAEGPWSLNATETEALGPLLTRVSTAIRGATDAERVYWMAFGELMPHFHVLLAPRLADAPPEMRGPALFSAREHLRDTDTAATVARRVRALL